MATDPQVRLISDEIAVSPAGERGDAAADTRTSARFTCVFCGRNQDEVAKLIAGPEVFICNECVARCERIIAADRFPQRVVRYVRERIAAVGRWLRADAHRTALWTTLSLIVVLQLAVLYGVFSRP